MLFSHFKKYQLVFLLALLVGMAYFYKVSSIPSSLYTDETTVGYNAYSILTTSKDEYGQYFPVAFRLFGAYTPPLFIYTLIPVIKIFGLNAISLRSISAVSTVAMVFVIYFLAQEIGNQKKNWPLVASLIFATAPWVFFNARLGYEVTLGYFLFYFGVLLLIKESKNKKLSLFGLILLSLSTYTAHTERYLVPIFLFGYLLLNQKKYFKTKVRSKNLLLLFVCLLTQLPHFYLMTTPAFWVKNQSFGSSSFSVGLWDFFNQLLVYYSPSTYFGRSTADINLQHFIPEISLFYSWQIVPFFVGLHSLLKSKANLGKKIIFFLLIISVVPAAFSGHFVSIQRILPIIVPIVITVSIGLERIYLSFPRTTIFLSIFLVPFSLMLLWRSYFVLFPGLRTIWWNFGASQVAEFISNHSSDSVIVDNSRDQALYSPIIFYLKASPADFQKQFVEIKNNYYKNPPFSPIVRFGKAVTRPIKWESDTLHDTYLVGDSLAISANQAKEHFLTKIIEIKDQTGRVHYQIYKTNPKQKLEDNAKKLEKPYN